jgi:hypothetical protein
MTLLWDIRSPTLQDSAASPWQERRSTFIFIASGSTPCELLLQVRAAEGNTVRLS